MHEASRRILSVILQRIEGFTTPTSKSSKSSSPNNPEVFVGNIVVCATNRLSDLDSALLSRYDVIIHYSLPDAETRKLIFKKYAKQLSRLTLNELSDLSAGFSNRDIKEVCEYAERSWAAKIIEQADVTAMKNGLPTSTDYIEALHVRRKMKEESLNQQSLSSTTSGLSTSL